MALCLHLCQQLRTLTYAYAQQHRLHLHSAMRGELRMLMVTKLHSIVQCHADYHDRHWQGSG